jgi:tetratricopeptide (TPR) repeat protein
MKYATTLLLIPLLLPLGLSAQTDAPRAIVRAYALVEQGHLTEAIALARPLVDSGTLQGAELGRAWMVLGLAYTDQSVFGAAQHAYEQAISILQPLPESVQDYASALDNLGLLYRAMGQLETATDLRLKALHIHEQISGIIRALHGPATIWLVSPSCSRT